MDPAPPRASRWLLAAAASTLLCVGALSGLHTARTIADEIGRRDGVSLNEHLAPLHVVQGAWTHHLKPLIFPLSAAIGVIITAVLMGTRIATPQATDVTVTPMT